MWSFSFSYEVIISTAGPIMFATKKKKKLDKIFVKKITEFKKYLILVSKESRSCF